MDRKVLAKRNFEWAEDKFTFGIGVLLTWSYSNNVYDTLVKGCPLDMKRMEEFGKGPFSYIPLLALIFLLYASMQALYNHGSKEYPLKPAYLLIHVIWSGVMLLYVFVLIAFLLDFFLVNITRFQ
jgi:hypothetical protein